MCIQSACLFQEWLKRPSPLPWLLPQLPWHHGLLGSPESVPHGWPHPSDPDPIQWRDHSGPGCCDKTAGLKQYLGLQASVSNSSRRETSLGPQSAPLLLPRPVIQGAGTRCVVPYLAEWQNLSAFKVQIPGL